MLSLGAPLDIPTAEREEARALTFSVNLMPQDSLVRGTILASTAAPISGERRQSAAGNARIGRGWCHATHMITSHSLWIMIHRWRWTPNDGGISAVKHVAANISVREMISFQQS